MKDRVFESLENIGKADYLLIVEITRLRSGTSVDTLSVFYADITWRLVAVDRRMIVWDDVVKTSSRGPTEGFMGKGQGRVTALETAVRENIRQAIEAMTKEPLSTAGYRSDTVNAHNDLVPAN